MKTKAADSAAIAGLLRPHAERAQRRIATIVAKDRGIVVEAMSARRGDYEQPDHLTV